MPDILLINPNTSQATTRMMVDIAAAALPAGFRVQGCTARSGVPMITNEAEMRRAVPQVLRSWQDAAAQQHWDGVIISAFGDPGIAQVRAAARVPVVGICEASLREGGAGARRFGVATVTPALAGMIDRQVQALGLAAAYTGIRLTAGDPRALAADPDQLLQALAGAVHQCVERDGAEAVVIGGGPLGQAAGQLQHLLGVPVVAPIPSAVRELLQLV